jgi:uncharacterized membrane protein
MIRLTWRTELPQWLVIAGMFLLAGVTWSWAPERIPVHWNVAGEVDRYGGKVEGLLGIPLLALGIYLLMVMLPRFDPGRANYPRFAGAYTVIRISLVTLLAVLYGVVHLWIRGRQVDVATVAPLLVGGLLIVLGSLMGKIRPNWFVGIRTPWTLSSKRAWGKTHRAGGWVFIAMGLATIATGVLRSAWAAGALLVILLGGTGGLIAYSYVAWRDADDKIPPAGTLPAEDA